MEATLARKGSGSDESFSAVETRYYRDLRLPDSLALELTERIIRAMRQEQPQLVVFVLVRKHSDEQGAPWRAFRDDVHINRFHASFVRYQAQERTRVELPDVGVALHDSLAEYNALMRVVFNLEERHVAWYLIHAHVKAESVPSAATVGGRITAALGFLAHTKLETYELVVDFPLTRHLSRQPALQQLKGKLALPAGAFDSSISGAAAATTAVTSTSLTLPIPTRAVSAPAITSARATPGRAPTSRSASSTSSSSSVAITLPRRQPGGVAVSASAKSDSGSSSDSSSGSSASAASDSDTSSGEDMVLISVDGTGDAPPVAVPAAAPVVVTKRADGGSVAAAAAPTREKSKTTPDVSPTMSLSRSTSTDKSFIAVNLGRSESSASLSRSRRKH